jgi:hypothetical protein
MGNSSRCFTGNKVLDPPYCDPGTGGVQNVTDRGCKGVAEAAGWCSVARFGENVEIDNTILFAENKAEPLPHFNRNSIK